MRRLPVVFREQASEDLLDIESFLFANGASYSVAKAYVDRIVAKCLNVGDLPTGYPIQERIGVGVRSVPENSATITYRVNEDLIEILNVYYGGQDL
ncbi:type II toxin-antitoxin system RelE/ParE family toxin [Devosia rhizoryzae]|uniref:Type II toxin-antitoxin system RelE/ParE family toxin n=1 Tax=Devosia rhizoryzae TaxID=2774137 RepID=A0ABX7C7S6_9HYPH|nr:type II toxin-antitoxin system RelE/ParE family toxin [Devosia rhizoryzae]QQR40309.1 type II toxin-antitoxin system RelE/ParE family toxin [Devosia rhizoryzae]